MERLEGEVELEGGGFVPVVFTRTRRRPEGYTAYVFGSSGSSGA